MRNKKAPKFPAALLKSPNFSIARLLTSLHATDTARYDWTMNPWTLLRFTCSKRFATMEHVVILEMIISVLHLSKFGGKLCTHQERAADSSALWAWYNLPEFEVNQSLKYNLDKRAYRVL